MADVLLAQVPAETVEHPQASRGLRSGTGATEQLRSTHIPLCPGSRGDETQPRAEGRGQKPPAAREVAVFTCVT